MQCHTSHMGKFQVCSGGRCRIQGKAEPKTFIVLSMGRARQGMANGLGWASLNGVRRLWAIGVVFSCSVPGSG